MVPLLAVCLLLWYYCQLFAYIYVTIVSCLFTFMVPLSAVFYIYGTNVRICYTFKIKIFEGFEKFLLGFETFFVIFKHCVIL